VRCSAAALFFLLPLACVHAPLRDEDRARWHLLTSEHFRVATALDEADAKAMVAGMEVDHACVSAALGGAPAGEKVAVLVLTSPLEMQWVAGSDAIGGFWETTPPNVMIVQGNPTGFAREKWRYRTTFRHELVHTLSMRMFPVQPMWLAEGLAGYIEDFAPAPQPNQIRIGVANPDRHRRHYALTVEDALATRNFTGAEMHEFGWLLVHYLVNRRPDDFKRYLTALVETRKPAQAWSQVFGHEDLRALNDAVLSYSFRGEYLTHVITVEGIEPDSNIAPMSDDDWRWFRAQAYRHGAEYRSTEEALTLYRAALETFPDDAMSLRGLADALVQAGRPAEALPYAQRGAAAEADEPKGQQVLASVLAALGRCADAVEAQSRAVALASVGPDSSLGVLSQGLERLRADCRAR
jgi:tetratricopeptide (TPR) repeat protein